MSGCTEMVIAGGILQVLGFGFVAIELWRIQHHELGRPLALVRAGIWFRKLLRLPPTAQTVALDIAGSQAGAFPLSPREAPPEGADVEQRLAVLERNFSRLDGEVSEAHRSYHDGLAAMRREMAHMQTEIEQQRQKREADRKQFLHGSIVLESIGTLLFVIGTALGVVGSTM